MKRWEMLSIVGAMWFATPGMAAVPAVDVPVDSKPVLEDRFPQSSVAFAPDVESMPDLVYSVPAGFRPLRLDLYRPRKPGNEARDLPLVVYVHGGGWQSGHTRHAGAFAHWPNVLALLASQGYAVASIEYRLSGEARFPAAIHDVKSAIRWLRSKSAEFGIDPTRAVIWGGSAGGQLAALAATSCNVAALAPDVPPPLAAQSDCVQGLVAWYAVFDFVNAPLSGAGDPPANSAVARFLGCSPADCRSVAALASPVSHLDTKDPPALLVHGNLDKVVPVEQSQKFEAALRANNIAVKLLLIKDVDHSFIGAHAADTRSASLQALSATIEFIDQTVGPQRPATPRGDDRPR